MVPEYDPYGERPVRSDHIGKGAGLPRAEQPDARQRARAKSQADARYSRTPKP